jgi:hypothetical protein
MVAIIDDNDYDNDYDKDGRSTRIGTRIETTRLREDPSLAVYKGHSFY